MDASLGTLDIFRTQENNGRNLHLGTILVCAKHFVAAGLADRWLTRLAIAPPDCAALRAAVRRCAQGSMTAGYWLTVIVWLTRLVFRAPALAQTSSARADNGCKTH